MTGFHQSQLLESIEEEGVEDYFSNQLTAFKKASLTSNRSGSIALNLQDSMVENHNFFNGISPPAAATSYVPVAEMLARQSIHADFSARSYAINSDNENNI